MCLLGKSRLIRICVRNKIVVIGTFTFLPGTNKQISLCQGQPIIKTEVVYLCVIPSVEPNCSFQARDRNGCCCFFMKCHMSLVRLPQLVFVMENHLLLEMFH